MSPAGDADLLVRTRAALLDALEAPAGHRDAVVVIGAQAIYLHTGGTTLALAEATQDSDLTMDPRALDPEPLVEEAMRAAGFELDTVARQPGAWVNADGIPVDLMVPEALAGKGGRRSARVPPHDNVAMRRAHGLEATVVDHAPMHVGALAPDDPREYLVNVASPAALLVAKLHKIGDREDEPRRLPSWHRTCLRRSAVRRLTRQGLRRACAGAPSTTWTCSAPGRARTGPSAPSSKTTVR